MTPMQRRGFLTLGTVAAGTLAAPRVLRAQVSNRTIADTMAGDTRFSRFLDIITRASLVEEFRQAAPLTVFAPVDQAFVSAPQTMLQDLLGGGSSGTGSGAGNVERTRAQPLINYHVVPGALTEAQLSGGDRRVRTLNGSDLQISGSPGNFTVRNPAPASQLGGVATGGIAVPFQPAQILGSPVIASNGVIYPISQVLIP